LHENSLPVQFYRLFPVLVQERQRVLGAILRHHHETAADVTLHLTRVEDPRAFGCVPTDSSGRVTAFLEKDPNPVTDQINAGCYVFNRSVVESIPVARPLWEL
jgi:mannose-1-phosphate guanylyltransferase